MAKNTTTKLFLGISLLLFCGLFLASVYVSADPSGSRVLTELETRRQYFADWSADQTDAYGGNITALNIDAISQTRLWQGYFGNISGEIVLDDANNNTFFNWTMVEPRGEVYANLVADGTPSWADVDCFEFAGTVDNETLEQYYGIIRQAGDGLTETYATTDHDTFQIGYRDITGCPTAYIWQDDTEQSTNFQNVLLQDSTDTTRGWIYATLVETRDGSDGDILCFDGSPCDFQLLVNDNGSASNIAPTPYYFWLELE